jgi:hypothetical protein
MDLKRILNRIRGKEPDSGNSHAIARAMEIARSTLDGQSDPLLACREMAALMSSLPTLPEEIGDTFVGVDSELDGLPIGEEGKYWAEHALEVRDAQAAEYRAMVRDDVAAAMAGLIEFLE